MQLTTIKTITGTLVLKSGLHIGAGDTEMRIGGTDNPVVKNPLDGQPYIPGSSLKGKIRSLLEWQLGLVSASEKGETISTKHLKQLQSKKEEAQNFLSLFGFAPNGDKDDLELIKAIGPTRIAFWDCPLTKTFSEHIKTKNLLATEVKSEVAINRISGTAADGALRFTERVIAGAEFDFKLSLKVIDGEDLLPLVLRGLKLLEADSLGGSGSRGYGKVAFAKLTVDGQDISLPENPFN